MIFKVHNMKRIAIFASGSGSNAEAIMNYFERNSYQSIEVALIMSNNPQAYVLERAKNHDVPSVVFTARNLRENPQDILDTLAEFKIDFIVLAGFMLLVPEAIIKAYRDRIINIHPALLPNYGGKGMYGDNVHKAVVANCETKSGITIHWVDEKYDSGSTIFQASCCVESDDTPESLAQRIHGLEHEHFPRVISETVIKTFNNIDMKLLLISNSTNAGEKYLDYPKNNIKDFLGAGVKKVLFIPYAGVTLKWDDYHAKVADRFKEIGYEVEAIHHKPCPVTAVMEAEAIVVGGGNTFSLLKTLQDNGLIEPIRQRVRGAGVPYIGWSAGSNMTCPTLCTTNDMPIVEPMSFKSLGLIPFQINPHYLDAHPDGHAGETREQRIEEYLEANKGMWVAGLREGCMFRYEGGKLEHIGPRSLRVFKYGQEPREVESGQDLSFLM